MKTAIARAISVEITCPYCGLPVEEPETGSQLWQVYDLTSLKKQGGEIYPCNECDKLFVLPSRVPVAHL